MIPLQFVLPTSAKPIALEARVVHTAPRGTSLLEVGVSFDEANPDAQASIAEAADFFLHKEE